MTLMADRPRFVEFKADDEAMLAWLREPLSRALEGRSRQYRVEIVAVGRVGEVLVSITGPSGRLPLLFAQEELDPGYVSSVVRNALEKFAF